MMMSILVPNVIKIIKPCVEKSITKFSVLIFMYGKATLCIILLLLLLSTHILPCLTVLIFSEAGLTHITLYAYKVCASPKIRRSSTDSAGTKTRKGNWQLQ